MLCKTLTGRETHFRFPTRRPVFLPGFGFAFFVVCVRRLFCLVACRLTLCLRLEVSPIITIANLDIFSKTLNVEIFSRLNYQNKIKI